LQEPSLVEEVERVTQQAGVDASAFVAEAVRRHLATYRQKRLRAESEAGLTCRLKNVSVIKVSL
jgi:metal-responsive CopG/Arc/MetJ family transcriptional regulator